MTPGRHWSAAVALGRRWIILVAAALVLAIGSVGAGAVQPDEMLADAALEKRAREISSALRCVVCQNQSIDDSDAALARDLRLLVRERLVAGDTDAGVFDAVVARYGEFVLLKPRFGMHTVVLWLLPFTVLAIVLAIFATRRRSGGVAASGTGELSRNEEQRLSELLDKSDGEPVAKE